MLKRWLGLLMLASLLPACSKFRKNFNNIAYECGIAETAVPTDRRLIKVVAPSGTDLSAVEMEAVRARYLAAAGSSNELTASPKGCFSLPDAAGVFQVFSLQGYQLSRRLDREGPGFQIIPLEKAQNAEAELVCPAQGYYADKKLDFPVRLTGSAALESSRIRLIARDTVKDRETQLFAKDYGESLPTGLNALDTAHLPDGSYELRLEATSIQGRWDAPVLPLNGRALCPLSILHQSPSIVGDTGLGPRVRSFYKKGDVINWTVDGAGSELRLCREAVGTDEDELAAIEGAVCQPRSCKTPEDFQAATVVRADTAGVFDYFFYAENRAGLTSELHCQRLVVSDQKPRLSIQWDESSWNRPLAVMARPVPAFSAAIHVQHPQRDDASLLKNLSCKLEFLLDGKAVLPGRDAVCLNGSCAGRRLDRFTPCASRLDVSLQEYWKEQKARPVLMRLHVQASDGAGQIAEEVKSVWIHPQRWQPEEGPMMPTFTSEAGTVRLTRDQSGNLFAHTSQSLMQWKADSKTWEFAELPFAEAAYNRMIVDTAGTIFVVGRTNTADGLGTLTFHEKTPDGWEELTPNLDFSPCLQGFSLPLPGGGFVCLGSDRYVQYQNKRWSEVPWPLQSDGTPCYLFAYHFDFKPVTLDRSGNVLRACGDGSLHRSTAEGGWAVLGQAKPSVTNLVVDHAERIWILESNSFSTEASARYLEGGQWTEVPLPSVRSDMSPVLTTTPAGTVLYYDYRWDPVTTSWKRLEGLDAIAGSTHYRPLPVGSGSLLLYAPNKLLLWDAGRAMQYPLSWYGIELRDYDINPYTVLAGTEQDMWFLLPERPGESRFRPIRVPLYPSNTFGPEVNLFSARNESRTYSYWLEKNGALTTLATDRGLIRSSDEGWKDLWTADDLNLFRGYRSGNGTYYLESGDQILRFREGDGAPQVIDMPGGYTVTALPSGRILVQRSGKRDGWIYSETGEVPLLHPEEGAAMIGTVAEIGGALFIGYYNQALYRLQDSERKWESIKPADLGWPTAAALPTFRSELKSQRYFLIVDGQLELMDPQGPSRSFKLPDGEFDASSVGKIVEIATDDFLLMVPSFGIYRGDGRQWKNILWHEDLQSRLKLEDRTYLHDMQLDPSGRLWVAGEYFRMLVLDL